MWAIIESLVHAAWETDTSNDLIVRLISCLLRRGKVISRVWLNGAISSLIKNCSSEKNMIYIIYYANPMMVTHQNFKELVNMIHQQQLNLNEGTQNDIDLHIRERLEKAMARRTMEFRHKLKNMKTEDERETMEEEMTLYLD